MTQMLQLPTWMTLAPLTLSQNYLRTKTIERLQGGISTFHGQLIVLVVTLCEAMTKEFFIVCFARKILICMTTSKAITRTA